MFHALLFVHLVLAAKCEQVTVEPVTSLNVCGLGRTNSNDRILNGQPTQMYEFPWVVSFFTYQPPNLPFFCTGSLINQRWILTSSSCVKNADHFAVYLGAYNLSAYEANRMTVYATDYRVEPETGYLALIQLTANITYNEFIRPVCLPTAEDPDHVGDPAILSGWGKFSSNGNGFSQVLRKAVTTIISSAICSEMFTLDINDGIICTDSSKGHAVCAGDQGSPLIYQTMDGRFVQIGVALLFSGSSCQAGQVNGFTRVRSYLKWINKVVGEPDADPTVPSSSGGYSATYSPLLIFVFWILNV